MKILGFDNTKKPVQDKTRQDKTREIYYVHLGCTVKKRNHKVHTESPHRHEVLRMPFNGIE